MAARAGKKGSETTSADVICHDAWGLRACRDLLHAFDEKDLRNRLESSLWLLHGGRAPDCINWLKEDATAFSIKLRKDKIRKSKPVLVEEVLNAVAAASICRAGAFAAQGAVRRSARLDTIRTQGAVRTAYQHLPWAFSLPAAGIAERREQILLCECPEDLRMGVASEFIHDASRMPSIDAAAVSERAAARYLASAMERLHASTARGQQLSENQVNAW